LKIPLHVADPTVDQGEGGCKIFTAA